MMGLEICLYDLIPKKSARILRNHDRHDDTADLAAFLLLFCRKDKCSSLAVKELHHEFTAIHVRENLDDEW